MKKYSVLGKLALLAATLFWGTSFVVLKDTLDLVPPNFLIALRFTVAGILLAIIFWKRLRLVTRQMLWRGCIIGVFLFLAYFWQTLGLQRTTPGKNAFLTAGYCVLVPFMLWAIRGPRPDRYNVIAAVLCLGGIGLISLEGDLSIGLGDLFTVVGGIFFGCHMVAIGKFMKDEDPVVMTVLQFAVAAVCFWIASFAMEGVPQGLPVKALLPIGYMSVFCTAVTLLLQNFGQKYTDPSAAAILLSLEAVFGAMFSLFLGKETLSVQVALGFVTIFLSVIVSETKLSFLKKAVNSEAIKSEEE